MDDHDSEKKGSKFMALIHQIIGSGSPKIDLVMNSPRIKAQQRVEQSTDGLKKVQLQPDRSTEPQPQLGQKPGQKPQPQGSNAQSLPNLPPNIARQGQQELDALRRQFEDRQRIKNEQSSRVYYSKIDTQLVSSHNQFSDYRYTGTGSALDMIAEAISNHLRKYPRHFPDVVYISSTRADELYRDVCLRYSNARRGVCYFAKGPKQTEEIVVKTEQDLPEYLRKFYTTLAGNTVICQMLD